MLSMFSAVSGHFTKGLVLGTLLPVLLFIAGAVPMWLLFTDGAPALAAGSVAFMTEQAAALGIFVVAATGALYNLNTPIIRFYEGYPWSRTAYGRRRIDHHKRRLSAAVVLQKALIAVRAGATDAGLKGVVQRSLNDASRVIAAEYPGEALVLPTRLGNVIRNAEEYPREQYGISAIPLWPRLVPLIGKEYGAALDEAKTSFDFFVNASALAALLAGFIAVLSVHSGLVFGDVRVAAACLALCLAAGAIAYAAYVAAAGAAAAWGGQIKGAFDLYRGALLKQLGYDRTFTSREDERKMWRAVSRQIVFGDPLDSPPLPYRVAEPRPKSRWDKLGELIWPDN